MGGGPWVCLIGLSVPRECALWICHRILRRWLVVGGQGRGALGAFCIWCAIWFKMIIASTATFRSPFGDERAESEVFFRSNSITDCVCCHFRLSGNVKIVAVGFPQAVLEESINVESM